MVPDRSRLRLYKALGIGLERGIVVRLEPYNQNWPRVFLLEADCISSSLDLPELELFHIGSTSVPGLSAKPIIDILGTVPSLIRLDAQQSKLEGIGYEYKGEYGISGRRYSVLYDSMGRIGYVNVHIYEQNHPEVEKHLLFCNYLRSNPAALKRYQDEKSRIINELRLPRSEYAKAKTDCIRSVLDEAEATKSGD